MATMVDHTEGNVVEGMIQLHTAESLRNKSRKKLICIVLIILTILGIIIGVSVSYKTKVHQMITVEHKTDSNLESNLIITTEG